MSDHGDITLQSIETERVIVMRIETNEAKLAEDLRRVFNEAAGKVLVSGGTQTGKRFIRYHVKGEYNPERLDIEICIPVRGISKAPIDWELAVIDGHKSAACVTHTGPYNKDTKPTYDRLFAWLDSKGLGPIAPIREVYQHEPFLTKPEALETVIVCPLPDGTVI